MPHMADFLQWLLHIRKLSTNTVKAYEADLITFSSFLHIHAPGESLVTLHHKDVRSFLAKRVDDGLCSRSIGRLMSSLRAYSRYLLKYHHISFTAVDNIEIPKIIKSLPRPLSESNAISLINSSNPYNKEDWIDLRDQALWAVLYGCGLRISEALALRIEDVSDNHDYIKVMGKGGKERLVPFIDAVRQRVMRYIASRPTSSVKFLFIGVRKDKLSPIVAARQMQRLRGLLGFDSSATPHALRHSFASHILQEGGDLRSIQELLGHASLSTTQQYTTIDQNKLMEIFKKSHPRG
jgi:integrase/recombinase XerC